MGLLHPVVLDGEHHLVSGQRRLEAFRRLGRTHIPARVAHSFDDLKWCLQAERDENAVRKAFTPEEAVHIGRTLEEIEVARATARRAATQKYSRHRVGKLPTLSESGRAKEKIAAAVGLGRRTYEKAEAVVVAAEADPAQADLLEQMNATGKVDPAYQALRARQGRPVRASGSAEWYTPEDLVARVVAALGQPIELDPASCAAAQAVVGAARYIDVEADGLRQDWTSPALYLNPPYGAQTGVWVKKLRREVSAGRVGQAVVLLPARTDTAWFRALREYPRAFVAGRVAFWGPADAGNGSPFPSAVFAVGCELGRFYAAFCEVADVYVRYGV